MARPKKEVLDENVDSLKVAAENFYKSNKNDIYLNPDPPYKVSTGVFSLDYLLGGGIPSGSAVRILGESSGGKSSEGLLIIKNFLEAAPGRRALIIPTENRLTEKLQGRSGVKYVYDPKDWEDGTALILPMNIYDKIANFIWTLVKTNEMRKTEDKKNFLIFIDCFDYLMLSSDFDKDIGEARKVAGPQYLTKMFWSKMALPFGNGQHIFMATSQQSAAPKLDPYSKEPSRQGGSSGGNNIKYQSTTVIELMSRYESDYILEDEDAKYDPQKNDKIGHIVRGYIRKSDNERYDVKFEYPIKYGRTGGNSVWIERELFDMLVAWQLLGREDGKAKGSLIWQPDIFNELKSIDPDIPDKFRSAKRVYEYLESKPEVTKFLYEKFKKMVQA